MSYAAAAHGIRSFVRHASRSNVKRIDLTPLPPDPIASFDDPRNPWSYAGLVPFVPSAVGKGCKALKKGDAALDTIRAGGGTPKPFAMGIDEHLDDFARQPGATTWKQFEDAVNWKPQVLDKLSDPNQRVVFNLDGVDVWGGAQRGAGPKAGATDWELFQLRQNPDFPNVEFWQGGQQVANPFK